MSDAPRPLTDTERAQQCRHFTHVARGRCLAGMEYAVVMERPATGAAARLPCLPDGLHLPCVMRLLPIEADAREGAPAPASPQHVTRMLAPQSRPGDWAPVATVLQHLCTTEPRLTGVPEARVRARLHYCAIPPDSEYQLWKDVVERIFPFPRDEGTA